MQCSWKAEEGARSPKAGLTGGCEPPYIGAGKQTWALSMSHLSSPPFHIGFLARVIQCVFFFLGREGSGPVSLFPVLRKWGGGVDRAPTSRETLGPDWLSALPCPLCLTASAAAPHQGSHRMGSFPDIHCTCSQSAQVPGFERIL